MSKIDDIIAARKAAEETIAREKLPEKVFGGLRVRIDNSGGLFVNDGDGLQRFAVPKFVLWIADFYGVTLPREPVKVPEPRPFCGTLTIHQSNYADGWNACREEVLRLNATYPQPATDDAEANPGPVGE